MICQEMYYEYQILFTSWPSTKKELITSEIKGSKVHVHVIDDIFPTKVWAEKQHYANVNDSNTKSGFVGYSCC